MKNRILKGVLIAFASISPALFFANRVEAQCQCEQVYRQGYGYQYLCCDQNGMCGYYSMPKYYGC